VLGAVLVSYLNPLIGLAQTYRGSSAVRAHLHELVAENHRLHDRVQSSDEPAVVELEARRQGMVAAGERAYVVRGLKR
jgi:hypothetical protein